MKKKKVIRLNEKTTLEMPTNEAQDFYAETFKSILASQFWIMSNNNNLIASGGLTGKIEETLAETNETIARTNKMIVEYLLKRQQNENAENHSGSTFVKLLI